MTELARDKSVEEWRETIRAYIRGDMGRAAMGLTFHDSVEMLESKNE